MYRPSGERMLDGKPCDLDRMMREANRLRKQHGLSQVGKKTDWHV